MAKKNKKDKEQKKKNSKVVFKLLVRDSSYKAFNFHILTLAFLGIVFLAYSVPPIFFTGLALVPVFGFFMFTTQVNYQKNLKAWDEGLPEKVEFWVDKENGKINVCGQTFYTKDVSWLRFKMNPAPKQVGTTKGILPSAFINAFLEFELTNKTFVQAPVQSKAEIHNIINTFLALDVRSSFDIKIYKECNLK